MRAPEILYNSTGTHVKIHLYGTLQKSYITYNIYSHILYVCICVYIHIQHQISSKSASTGPNRYDGQCWGEGITTVLLLTIPVTAQD